MNPGDSAIALGRNGKDIIGTETLLYECDYLNSMSLGTSLVGQWLRFRASTAGGTCSIPGQETKSPHAVW